MTDEQYRERREKEYRAGYDLAAGRTLEDGCSPGEYDYEHAYEMGTNETTWRTRKPSGKPAEDGYGKPISETTAEKFDRLWTYNSGVDGHRLDGRTVGDMGKVEQKVEDKVRLAHAVANTVSLPPQETDVARNLARRIDASKAGFSWWGGWMGLVLAIVAFVATLLGRDVYTDCQAFRREVEERMGGLSSLRKGMTKVAERFPEPRARPGTAVAIE